MNLLKYIIPALALGAAVSCAKESVADIPQNPADGKELIAFTQEGSAMTKGLATKAGFGSDTNVVMRIVAEKIVPDGETAPAPRYAEAEATAEAEVSGSSLSNLKYISGQERYWDDAFGRDSKLTVYAFAIPDKKDATLPAWAKTDWMAIDASTNKNWHTASKNDTKVSWEVATEQTATTMSTQDLTYSNNISTSGKGGRYTYNYASSTDTWVETPFQDGPLTWTPKTTATGETTGKFDKGHLVFNHALAWIEINLKEGAGFDNSSNADFKWSKNQTFTGVNQNITLAGFNTSGTFDVADGTWSGQSSTPVTQMNERTGTPDARTTRQLYAYVLPGTNLYTTTTNVVEFEIDNAQYYISGQKIAEAIRSYYTTGAGKDDTNASTYQSFTTIEAGKHYVINLTVSKKSVDRITAAIIDWETVNSNDAVAENTYPEFTLDERGTKLNDGQKNQFALYRAAQTASDYITGTTEPNYDWKTGYGAAAGKQYNTTNSLWETTGWFWENNLTYYHFRAAGYTENNAETGVTVVTDATNGDYYAIKSGALSGSDYKDYVWGAPFNQHTGTLTYSKYDGFDNASGTTHQISQAIGTTASTINMLLLHMTSQITVNVRTTTDAASKVSLKDDAKTELPLTKVEILNFLPDGKVLMGNGLVSATSTTRTEAAAMSIGTYAAAEGSEPDRVNGYTYGIVPQALSWGSGASKGTIGLRITTPDGNQYLVKDLSTCTATVTSHDISNTYTLASGSNYTIDKWYPGFRYNYTIAIKKTGVERITAAVVDWETVSGELGTIDLEN